MSRILDVDPKIRTTMKKLGKNYVQLSIRTVFDEESDFQVKNKEIQRPDGKN